MGIKKKFFLAFILLALILLLSCVISVFEFGRMNNKVSAMISDNLSNVNTARKLLMISDDYNTLLLESLSKESDVAIPDVDFDKEFLNNINKLRGTIDGSAGISMVDSVLYAFTAYMHVLQEVELVWKGDLELRNEWYFGRLQPIFKKLKTYAEELSNLSQRALEENYYDVSENFYRSIMPSIVATGVGIVLVFLFNYFLNSYLIKPVLKIKKGLEKYREYNRGYDIEFDGKDEIFEINNHIHDIIEENRRLKRIK